MSKPLILVSNDDGITSRGIRKLVELMQKLGEVIVVAPNGPRSGMGHAITVGDTLRLRENNTFPAVQAFECSGTPADCVKLAKHHVLKGRRPDLVVSGINHGSNSSISVLYSGTVSAAIEGAIEGLPSISFSLCDFDAKAAMDHVEKFVLKIARKTLEKGIPKGIALNVNIPAKRNESIKGIKVVRQADAKWDEDFEERIDPFGQKYYWMIGDFVSHDIRNDNDEWTLANNYVSIVPCHFDMTSYSTIDKLGNDWAL